MSASPDVSVYVDTNCFIHLRDVRDLPWRELFPNAKHVEIVVAPAVRRELDRLKHEGRRRRDRSRSAIQTILRASGEKGHRLFLSEGDLKVSLRPCPSPKIDWTEFPDLDPTQADDQIVACAAMDTCEGRRAFLSYDGNPLVSARMIGLEAHECPDAWHLPEERDEQEQELAKLRREAALAKSTRPTIAIEFLDNGEPAKVYDRALPILEPLTANRAKAIREKVLERNPRHQLRLTVGGSDVFSMLRGMSAISQEDIQQYGRDYEKYEASVDEFVGQLAAWILLKSRSIEVRYRLRNTSLNTAERLLVEFRKPAECVVEAGSEVIRRRMAPVEFPEAPAAPLSAQEKMQAMFRRETSRLAAPYLGSTGPRNPTRFYTQDGPVGDSPLASRICEEFRGGAEGTHSYGLIVPHSSYIGQAEITLSARNLPVTEPHTIAIRTHEEPMAWDDPRVLAKLPTWLANIVSANA